MSFYRPRVYTASKPHYVKLWRSLREDPDWGFVDWTASWVTHPDIDAEVNGILTSPGVFSESWAQNVRDVKDSDFVLLYGNPNDAFRGSLIECGIGIGIGIGVLVVGPQPDPHSWIYLPGVRCFPSLREARLHIYRFITMAPPSRRGKKGATND